MLKNYWQPDSESLSFVNAFSETTVRFIGISEVIGAVGLILPSALRIMPILTPIAATGISAIMLLATNYHMAHNEPLIPSLLMFCLALFVAWGRFRMAPIQPK